MKKFTLFIVVVLCIAHLVNAQLKLYVYENNGEVTSFVASNVDSIAFTAPSGNPVEPADEITEYVEMGLSVRWAKCNVGANASSFGYYWTSTLDINDSTKAKQFAFNEDGHNLSSSTRYFGQTIRPVMP